MTLQYLSFADPNLPAGSQWLGAVILEAPDFITAVMLSHMKGLNPGGEVVGLQVDFPPPSTFVGRLLSRGDLEAMDVSMGGDGQLEVLER